jgi:RNA polymerase sigma-70 factor, ECF subfamily
MTCEPGAAIARHGAPRIRRARGLRVAPRIVVTGVMVMAAPLDLSAASDGEVARLVTGGASPRRARAEAEICARFGPRVRLYGLRHLRDEDAAQELVQRVLVRVLEKLRDGSVREPDQIASFTLGVARMTAREMGRGRGRLEPLGPEHEEIAVAAGGPERLSMHALARCFEQLGERERSVMVLAFFQDRSAGEIGRDLSLSEGNVRVIRHRALERLRGCMGLGEDA